MKNTLSRDEFACALYCADYSALMDMSTEVHAEGDTSYFVTTLPNGRFAAWDDYELAIDRVEYFDFYFEAENATTVAVAQNIEDKDARFMFVLRALEEQLDRSHREGHCEHAGHCEIIPILADFLESEEGNLSLDGFGDWYSSQTPSELFDEIVGGDFISADWIHEDELSAWSQAVREADIEHVVVMPAIPLNRALVGDITTRKCERCGTHLGLHEIDTTEEIAWLSCPEFLADGDDADEHTSYSVPLSQTGESLGK